MDSASSRRTGAAARAARPINATALWIGGLLAACAAVVVALTGDFVGCLVFCGVIRSVACSGAAALAAVLATGLMHLLLMYTAHPLRIFGYLMVLGTLTASCVPFVEEVSWIGQPTRGGVILMVGVTIGVLVAAAAQGAVRAVPLSGGPAGLPTTRPPPPDL